VGELLEPKSKALERKFGYRLEGLDAVLKDLKTKRART